MSTTENINTLLDAECAVLGAMVLHQECAAVCSTTLIETDFVDMTNRILFIAIVKIAGRGPVEAIELLNEASTGDHSDKRQSLAVRVAEIQEGAASPTTIKPHLERIKDRALRTTLIRTCHVVLSNAKDESITTANLLNDVTLAIGSATTRHIGVEEYNHEKSVFAFTEKAVDPSNKNKMKGYRSSCPDIDKVISGWQKGKMHIVGGLKKTGKSRYAISLASQWLMDGLNGIIYSMEMSENQIHTCVFGNRLEINTAHMGTSLLRPTDYQRIMEECNNYSKQNLWISKKSAITPAYIRQTIATKKHKHKPDFVIVDYIQRMTAPGTRGRTEEVEQCAMALADIGRDENVIMVVLSQLSGEAEGGAQHKGPVKAVYSMVKNSQTIIEAADVVVILQDPNRGKTDEGFESLNFKDLSATILQRDGESDVSIPVIAQLQYSKFNSKSGRIE